MGYDSDKNRIAYYSERGLTVLLLLAFAGLLWEMIDININHFTVCMDSDMASATLLGQVLYNNRFLTPDTWYGSTGICILTASNVAAFMHPLTGQNLNLSMGIACSLMTVLFFAVMFVYYRQMKFTWLEILTMAVIMLSLSNVHGQNLSQLFLFACYNMDYIIGLFIISIFYTYCLKRGKVTPVVFLATMVIALVQGLQGLHILMFCYMPLLGTELLRRIVILIKTRKAGNDLIITVWLAVMSGVAYIGTKILDSYSPGTSRNIRHAGEKFVEIILPFMGEIINVSLIPVLVWVVCIAGVIGYLLFAVKLFAGDACDNPENEDYPRWGCLSYVACLLIFVLSTTFTTMEAAPRYYIMELFIAAMGTALFIQKTDRRWSIYLAVPVIIIGIMAGRYYYAELISGDDTDTSQGYQIAQWMLENGYDYGYSTFDHANKITVISNDRVKIRAVNSFEELEGSKWLSDSGWYPPAKDPSLPVCYVVSRPRLEEFQQFVERERPDILDEKEFDSYVVYVTDHDYTIWVD